MPSTVGYDWGEKFYRYRTWLPTLTDYVLVAQDAQVIDHYHREAADVWTLRTVAGLVASLHVETLVLTVALTDVYEGVEFPEEDNRAQQAC